MRTILALTLFALASGPALAADLAKVARAPAPAAPAAAAKPAAPAAPAPVPGYVVVEGAHSEAADPAQMLTVICPARHKAFGAGFAALVKDAAASAKGTPAYRQGGLNSVMSIPDSAGNGWRVTGSSPDAAQTHQPWKLVVRVVCVQIGG